MTVLITETHINYSDDYACHDDMLAAWNHALQKIPDLYSLLTQIAAKFDEIISLETLVFYSEDFQWEYKKKKKTLHTHLFFLQDEKNIVGKMLISKKVAFKKIEIEKISAYLKASFLPLYQLLRYEKAVNLARLDALTGLSNTVEFQKNLKKEIDLARRHHHLFSTVIIDLDHFKQINDKYGHSVGNQLLVHFSKVLKQTLRGSDSAFRIGGDEFSVLLQHTNVSGAQLFCERLRKCCEETPLKTGKKEIDFTISVGFSCYLLGDDDQTLYDRADKALYHSKQKGRNAVSLLA